jgi:hypothetical protein
MQRHVSNKDCLITHTACLVCFISTVNAHSQKRSPGRPALVAGTLQTLQSILETFDLYASMAPLVKGKEPPYLNITVNSSNY